MCLVAAHKNPGELRYLGEWIVGVIEAWIPKMKGLIELIIQQLGTGLKQQVLFLRRPLHLCSFTNCLLTT